LDDRYLIEDVPHGAIPLQVLAKIAGVHTPVLDGCIALASQLIDLPTIWNAEFLGVAALETSEITAYFGQPKTQKSLYLLPSSPISDASLPSLLIPEKVESIGSDYYLDW
jgi:hypothetical protein